MNLRKLRLAKGLSVKQLADAIGVSDAFIRYAEYGERTPSLKTAKRIVKVLGCTLDELFADDTI